MNNIDAVPAGKAVQTSIEPFRRYRVLKLFCRHKIAVAGLVIISLFILCAIFAPFISPHDPYAISADFESPPTSAHLLGTDQVGRDVLSRLIYASRISITVGIGVVFFTVLIGTAFGLISGYFGGITDMFIMRLTDIFMSFPMIILIMVVVSIIGPGLDKIIVIMGLLGWPSVARLVRGNVLSIKETDYIKAAVASGLRTSRILFFHILPNTISPILVNATFGIASAIIMESALSFLGLGVNPPTASWGNMLSDAQSITVLTSMPWQWIPPGVMIILNVLSFNFVGDALRDALDPRNTIN